MKAHPKYLGVFAATFLAGAFAVFIWHFTSNIKPTSSEPFVLTVTETAPVDDSQTAAGGEHNSRRNH